MSAAPLQALAQKMELLQAVFDLWQRALQTKHNEVAPIYSAGKGVVHSQSADPLSLPEAEARVWLHMQTAVDPTTSPALSRIARDLADELTATIQLAQGAQS